jgi:hypothetical protein
MVVGHGLSPNGEEEGRRKEEGEGRTVPFLLFCLYPPDTGGKKATVSPALRSVSGSAYCPLMAQRVPLNDKPVWVCSSLVANSRNDRGVSSGYSSSRPIFSRRLAKKRMLTVIDTV